MALEVRERAAPAWNWSGQRGDLPDVNVWFAISNDEHPHHQTAKNYWDTTLLQFNEAAATHPELKPEQLHFCRHTANGLVRLLSQKNAMLGKPLTMHQAWLVYQGFRKLEEVAFTSESVFGDGLDRTIEAILGSMPEAPSKLWTDITIAATAKLHGLRMVTFDKDFKRFGLIDLLVLPT